MQCKEKIKTVFLIFQVRKKEPRIKFLIPAKYKFICLWSIVALGAMNLGLFRFSRLVPFKVFLF